jgi:hypothetical protein
MKTTTGDRQATWCQSALAEGETVMEDMAKNNEPQDDTIKQTAEGLAHLLDSINTEADDMVDLETAEDSANSSTEIQPKEEGAKTEMDTSVDDKDEDEKMLVEKEKLNTDTEEAETTGEENASVSILSDKISAIVDRIVEEKISAIAQQPSKNLSGDGELEPGVEGQAEVGSQKPEGDLSNDELADLMNSRIEKIVIRILEEQMPGIAERSILDAMKKILLSME